MSEPNDNDRAPKTWLERMRSIWTANYNQSMNVLAFWDNLFRAAFEQNYKTSEDLIRLSQQSVEEMREQSEEMIEMMRKMAEESAERSKEWSPEKAQNLWNQFLQRIRSS